MKRTLWLAILLSLAAPLLAVAAESSATSLEALRAAIFTPAAPAPGPGEAPAGTLWRTTCTVTNDCGPYSPTISCTSASGDCKSGTNASGNPFVKCDGVRTNCAPCQVSTTCSIGGGTVSCTGTIATDCAIEPGCSVTCSGVEHGCFNCQ